jgi:hypothetical protein
VADEAELVADKVAASSPQLATVAPRPVNKFETLSEDAPPIPPKR